MGNPLALGLPGLIPRISRTCWLFRGKTGIPGPNTTVFRGALGLLPLIGSPGAGRPYPGVGRQAQDEYRMPPGACRAPSGVTGPSLDAYWVFLGLAGQSRSAQEGPGGT